jgi:hypothetical protein
MSVYGETSALEALLSSTARVQVLRLFLTGPAHPFYQREIERASGQPIRAVQREVERLEGIGLLLRSSEGNRVFYRLNPLFPLLDELTALFHRAFGTDGAAPLSTPQAPLHEVAPRAAEPFDWMETPQQQPLPAALRKAQGAGDWDRGY